MKSVLKTTAIAVLSVLAVAQAEEKITLNGNVQTQGTKALYDNDKDNNLDGFWFRANLGGKYNSEDFEGQINIRMYAQNVGNKIQADTYWGKYKYKAGDALLSLKLGHWKTDWSRSGNFGTYIDQNLKKRGFLARDYSHDAFEFGYKQSISELSVMLATTDENFNTGYIRIQEDLKFNDALKASLAYRVNAIDPIQNTAVLTHRVAAKVSYEIMKNFGLYGEVAVIATGEDEDLATAENAVEPEYKQDTQYIPFFVGIEIPTNGILSNLYAEFEYVKDREDFEEGADDFAWTVGIVKKINSHLKIQYNIYSEKEISDVAMGLRLTTSL